MIKFITDKEPGIELTFEDVEENQFFVQNEWLYHKVNSTTANSIANSKGFPLAGFREFSPDDEINRIIPKVIKIKF